MMKQLLYLAVFSIVFVACKPGGNRTNESQPADKAPTEVTDQIDTGMSSVPILRDSVIYSDYPTDNLPMEKLTRTLTETTREVHVMIQNARRGEEFFVEVEHERPDGNIRISRVLLADGSADGPFGRSVTYKAPIDGDILFVFGPSQMASGSPEGEILITLVRK